MQKPWYQTARRRNVVDMHITDWREGFLSEVDPRRYVELLKRCGLQSTVLYANSHVGLCCYPTQVGRMHPGLRGRDVFGAILERCQRNGIAVVGYVSLIFDCWAYNTHPDWRIIRADGKGGAEGNRYGVCCPNSPYRDYAVALADELCRNYPVDGIRFDMTFWPGVCYCPHCRRRYAAEIGGELPTVIQWDDPKWVLFQRQREQWLNEFAALTTASVKRVRPQASVEHQASTFPASWVMGVTVDLAKHNDFLEGDFYGGALQGSFVKKLLHNLTPKRPCGFETSCALTLGDLVTLKSQALLTCKAFSAVAHDAAFIFIDSVDPVGTLNPAVYRRMRAVFRQTAPYDAYSGGTLCQDVGLYFSTESKFSFAQNGKTPLEIDAWNAAMPHLEAVMGVARTLIQHHIPFGVVTRANLDHLAKYRVLILPDVLMMSKREAEAIRDYVRRGGAIYASKHTSAFRSDGAKLDDFMLADVFGASYRGETAHSLTYVAPTPAGSRLLADCTVQHPLCEHGTQMRARSHRKAQVLGTLVLPYTDPADASRFVSIHCNPPGIAPKSDADAIVFNRFGKGRSIYVGGQLERENYEPHQKTFLNLLHALLLRQPLTFEADAPKVVEIVAFHQADRRRYIFSLLNFQEELPNVPVSGIRLRVRLGRGRKLQRAILLPKEKPLTCSVGGRVVTVAVPRLETFHMLAVEYEPG